MTSHADVGSAQKGGSDLGCEPNAVGLESHDPPKRWLRAKSLLDHD